MCRGITVDLERDVSGIASDFMSESCDHSSEQTTSRSSQQTSEGRESPAVRVHQPYCSFGFASIVTPMQAAALRETRRQVKPWKQIPVEDYVNCTSETTAFPAGWTFNAYDGNLQYFYEIPSENVQPTHGAIRYIEHFNETGPYSRFRFQCCHNFVNGKCRKGFECTYIHPRSLTHSCSVHVNGLAGYETLPPGYSMYIFAPSLSAPPQLIATSDILRTKGSEKVFHDLLSGKGSHRPQHCAHFQFKRLCNRGDQCSFIHSTVPSSD